MTAQVMTTTGLVIQSIYFLAIFMFILGLKKMSSPVTARKGIVWAGFAMAIATIATYFAPGVGIHWFMITLAILIGGVVSWWGGRVVKMTDMPQMIALFNGLGGGAAATISAVELLGDAHGIGMLVIGVLGAMIGSISFSGSIIAFLKLQGWMNKSFRFPKQHFINLTVFLCMVGMGAAFVLKTGHPAEYLYAVFGIALVLGVLTTVPIGGADMPVVISLYNAFTGLAVAMEGFVLSNPAMIIAGIIVGSAGTILTLLMADAMNRSIANILFSNFGETSVESSGDGPTGSMKAMEPTDAAAMIEYAEKVVFVPGYGMAVAQAQHKVWELTQMMLNKGIDVKFAIHPVAGRMPGHMNVLLAEAGVPYDLIYDIEDINEDFKNTDVAIVIGANDVVNPDARSKKDSPIYGMPILNADAAKHCFCVKRGKGTGFSGIQNPLFFLDNTYMLYGDAQGVMSKLIQGLKLFEM